MPFKSDLRRSQVVTTFGVGATYDYVEFPGMTLTVDEWQLNPRTIQKLKVNNFRFVEYLNKVLKNYEGVNAVRINKLIEPPVAYDQMQKALHDISGKIEVATFPKWSVCMTCNALMKHSPAGNRRCTNNHLPNWKKGNPCSTNRHGSKTEPVRFIAYCQKGHIQDIPWPELMATNCDENCVMLKDENHGPSNPSLYLDDNGQGGGFSSLRITCKVCGKSKALTGISQLEEREKIIDQNGNKIFSCNGEKPWLGPTASNEQCEELLDVQPRGASKIYLPIHKSAIYVPDPDNVRHEILDNEQIISIVQKIIDGEREIRDIEGTLDMTNLHGSYDLEIDETKDLIIEEINRLTEDDQEVIEQEELDRDFLFKEYQTLIQNSVDDEDFKSDSISLDSYKNLDLEKYFLSLHQIKKVKTATALIGFERQAASIRKISPEEKFNPARENVDFLPCSEVTGEGIFINFGYEKIKNWLNNNSKISEITKNLKNNAKNSFLYEKLKDSESLDAGFVLIHSFSHALMTQLAMECGYGITELLERIYFSKEKEMAGVLIYTASADSSGSLGGLVRTIKPELFEGILKNAIENSRFCSNDPICSESDGQGLGGMNLAACHACLMVPDLACCTFPKNILLDRNSLIGSETDAQGYFLDL